MRCADATKRYWKLVATGTMWSLAEYYYSPLYHHISLGWRENLASRVQTCVGILGDGCPRNGERNLIFVALLPDTFDLSFVIGIIVLLFRRILRDRVFNGKKEISTSCRYREMEKNYFTCLRAVGVNRRRLFSLVYIFFWSTTGRRKKLYTFKKKIYPLKCVQNWKTLIAPVANNRKRIFGGFAIAIGTRTCYSVQ